MPKTPSPPGGIKKRDIRLELLKDIGVDDEVVIDVLKKIKARRAQLVEKKEQEEPPPPPREPTPPSPPRRSTPSPQMIFSFRPQQSTTVVDMDSGDEVQTYRIEILSDSVVPGEAILPKYSGNSIGTYVEQYEVVPHIFPKNEQRCVLEPTPGDDNDDAASDAGTEATDLTVLSEGCRNILQNNVLDGKPNVTAAKKKKNVVPTFELNQEAMKDFFWNSFVCTGACTSATTSSIDNFLLRSGGGDGPPNNIAITDSDSSAKTDDDCSSDESSSEPLLLGGEMSGETTATTASVTTTNINMKNYLAVKIAEHRKKEEAQKAEARRLKEKIAEEKRAKERKIEEMEAAKRRKVEEREAAKRQKIEDEKAAEKMRIEEKKRIVERRRNEKRENKERRAEMKRVKEKKAQEKVAAMRAARAASTRVKKRDPEEGSLDQSDTGETSKSVKEGDQEEMSLGGTDSSETSKVQTTTPASSRKMPFFMKRRAKHQAVTEEDERKVSVVEEEDDEEIDEESEESLATDCVPSSSLTKDTNSPLRLSSVTTSEPSSFFSNLASFGSFGSSRSVNLVQSGAPSGEAEAAKTPELLDQASSIAQGENESDDTALLTTTEPAAVDTSQRELASLRSFLAATGEAGATKTPEVLDETPSTTQGQSQTEVAAVSAAVTPKERSGLIASLRSLVAAKGEADATKTPEVLEEKPSTSLVQSETEGAAGSAAVTPKEPSGLVASLRSLVVAKGEADATMTPEDFDQTPSTTRGQSQTEGAAAPAAVMPKERSSLIASLASFGSFGSEVKSLGSHGATGVEVEPSKKPEVVDQSTPIAQNKSQTEGAAAPAVAPKESSGFIASFGSFDSLRSGVASLGSFGATGRDAEPAKTPEALHKTPSIARSEGAAETPLSSKSSPDASESPHEVGVVDAVSVQSETSSITMQSKRSSLAGIFHRPPRLPSLRKSGSGTPRKFLNLTKRQKSDPTPATDRDIIPSVRKISDSEIQLKAGSPDWDAGSTGQGSFAAASNHSVESSITHRPTKPKPSSDSASGLYSLANSIGVMLTPSEEPPPVSPSPSVHFVADDTSTRPVFSFESAYPSIASYDTNGYTINQSATDDDWTDGGASTMSKNFPSDGSGIFATDADIDDMWLAKLVLTKYANTRGISVDDIVEDVCDKLDAIESTVFRRKPEVEVA